MSRARYSSRTHFNIGSVQAQVFTDSAGTDLTATFTEANKLAGVTGGTNTASKALVVDAQKALDTLGITGQQIVGGTGVAGAAATFARLTGKKTAIADNTATDIITVTVPNANHAAAIRLVLLGSLGTGSDAFESSRCAEGLIVIARQTGAATVAVAATLALAQIATAAGGGTLTMAYAVSSITGAVGVSQSFTITVTLVKTGTITDLQCVWHAEVLNAEATGVTIAAA